MVVFIVVNDFIRKDYVDGVINIVIVNVNFRVLWFGDIMIGNLIALNFFL